MSSPSRFPGKIDWLLLGLALLAAFMVWGPGGSIAIIAAISLIGLPIAVVLWGLPFAALVLLPWRGLFLLLRRWLPKWQAVLLSLALVGGALLLIDTRFPRGPNPDLLALLAQDGPVPPFAPLPDGRLGLVPDPHGKDGQGACNDICLRFLSLEGISEVVLNPGQPGATGYRRKAFKDACPTGWTAAHDTLCQRLADGPVPLVLTVTEIDLEQGVDGLPPESRDRIAALLSHETLPLKGLTRLTLTDARDGTTATVHVALAATRAAGLFGWDNGGIMGEALRYGPRVETRIFTSIPDLPEDRPPPKPLFHLRAQDGLAPLHFLVIALGMGSTA